MDFFHCPIKIISRNKGRSAVAASAYISATRMENTWDGTTHDYTRKRHVVYSTVMLPEHAPPEYADRNVLWNSVEWSEKTRDAQLARAVELALPTELTHEQNIALIRKFVQETFVDRGMCADVAFHDKGDGNPHVHIMLTMRALQEDGRWAPKSRLVYNLDANGNRIPAKQKGRWKTHKENTVDWDDRGNAEIWRAAAADAINEALREAGFTQGFVDHRSYARQGKNRIPMVHEGPEARAMEQRGIRTDVGDKNREIREQNKLLAQLEARLARLNAWAQYEKKMDAALIAQGQDVTDLNLRYLLASRVFESTVPPNRKDRRLEDATGLMVIMRDYNITDATSYAEAVKQANAKFYDLRSRRKENADLSSAIGARIHAYEDRKKYQRYYSAWSRLSGSKASVYERDHEFELRKYREANEALNRWEADGERIDYKGWQMAMKHLNKERFMLDYELHRQKEEIRRLEVVKREFIKERKRSQSITEK
ncbi:MAG: MobQ family relaxase [Aristaeellaceae bacterium]